MTIQEAKNKLITWARAQIGYVEGANNWNKYAPTWTSAGGWNAQNQPWCDVFVDAGFIACFGLDTAAALTYQKKGAFSAKCSISADYYKQHGAWTRTPEPGDQIFFYYDGGINHTGIVESVSNGLVTTIEGNSSDMVARRTYAVGSSQIAGYGRPNWGILSAENPDPVNNQSSTPAPAPQQEESCTVTVKLPVIKYSDEGLAVKIMQSLLIARGYSCGWWGADGDYGNGTKDALLRFQKNSALEQDGICGTQSWKKLLEV